MKVVALSGSNVGSKTRTAMEYAVKTLSEEYEQTEVELIDLADYELVFSDGRNYLDYEGDTRFVAEKVMGADVLIIGTPVFQASIPAVLKNVFDLLPGDALQDKVVSMIVTAGSGRHYLTAEHQLKPILTYMKAQIVPSYVYIEEKDFYQKAITNDDVLFRIDQLIEDTVVLGETYQKIRERKEAEYGF